MKQILIALGLILSVGSLPPVALAQKGSRNDQERAKEHFNAARRAFSAEDYAAAAREFRAAYDFSGEPEMYFNLGEVYRKWDKPERALDSYKTYLELDPDGRATKRARAAIDEIEAELERERQRGEGSGWSNNDGDGYNNQGDAPSDEDELTIEDDEDPDDEGSDNLGADLDDTEDQEGPSSPGSTLRISGLVVGALGVAGVGASVYFGMQARKNDQALSDADMFDKELFAAGQTANRRMILSAAIGGGALATGVVLYILGVRRDRAATEEAHLSISATQSDVFIGARGRF